MEHVTPLQRYLARTGLTARQFAARCGLPEFTVSRIRKGRRPPTLRQAAAIEAATDGEIPAAAWASPRPADAA